MVLYGTKVNIKRVIYNTHIFDFVFEGETNRDFNRDFYTCSFSKMIENWRKTWNNRTNGIADIQFPFGFVQVSVIQHHNQCISSIVSNIHQ